MPPKMDTREWTMLGYNGVWFLEEVGDDAESGAISKWTYSSDKCTLTLCNNLGNGSFKVTRSWKAFDWELVDSGLQSDEKCALVTHIDMIKKKESKKSTTLQFPLPDSISIDELLTMLRKVYL